MKSYDISIIGGGLAGLTAAIDLSRFGYSVVLFEMNAYPHHKVCGEYVSNEVYPYLQHLGIDLLQAGAIAITDFEISTVNGYKTNTKLPLGGMGISRYAFDHLLYKKAKEQGVQFHFCKVTNVNFKENLFYVNAGGNSYTSKIAIGAYGKRSVLDKKLERDFSFQKYSWLAVKGHFKNARFQENLVGLHNFEGGYGGLSKIENGHVNFCYLAHYDSFKRYNDIEKFNAEVVSKNKFLNLFLNESKPIFDNPLTIAQISFEKKEPVVNHILMCGDTTGLIHPLCGNGMAMAIHSAKIASELVQKFLDNKAYDRSQLENDYQHLWNISFRNRLWFGRKLQSMLLNKRIMNIGIRTLGNSERFLKYIITKTHGKTIAL